MIHSDGIGEGEPLYVEKMPYRCLGSSIKKRYQIYLLQWFTRIVTLILLGYFVYILLFEPMSRDTMEWMAIAMIAVVLMIYGSEIRCQRDIRASRKIYLYFDSIEMHTTLLERILGKKNRIEVYEIEKIKILRYKTIENLETKQSIRRKH